MIQRNLCYTPFVLRISYFGELRFLILESQLLDRLYIDETFCNNLCLSLYTRNPGRMSFVMARGGLGGGVAAQRAMLLHTPD